MFVYVFRQLVYIPYALVAAGAGQEPAGEGRPLDHRPDGRRDVRPGELPPEEEAAQGPRPPRARRQARPHPQHRQDTRPVVQCWYNK